MSVAQLALLLSRKLILAGIAYPDFARTKDGWKVGAWTGGGCWALWYGFGALAYLAGMWTALGWIGLPGSRLNHSQTATAAARLMADRKFLASLS